METSSKRHAAQPTSAAQPISEESAEAMAVGGAGPSRVELPVPRVDDDDFAPTIVRGLE